MSDVESYLANLVAKQHAHFDYLENKMHLHLRDVSLSDWLSTHRASEGEIVAFFEHVIRNPLASTSDLAAELALYFQSFRRNIEDLDD